MKNKIITIVLVSAAFLLFQGYRAFAAITPLEVVTLVNQERSSVGLPVLVESTVLDAVAQAKADDMAAEEYFSHTSPKGVTPWDFFREAKYEYRYAGENLAIHFRHASSEERAWMESKKHCENILSPKYLETGAAVREMRFDGEKTLVTVQVFGTQMKDASRVNLSDGASLSCPKVYPSVLGETIPIDMNHGGAIASISQFLDTTATHWKIDTPRLLVLAFVIFLQIVGMIVVLLLAKGSRPVMRW